MSDDQAVEEQPLWRDRSRPYDRRPGESEREYGQRCLAQIRSEMEQRREAAEA